MGVARSGRSLQSAATADCQLDPCVDGRDVRWWARRARQNGETMRLRGRTLARIRTSLRAHVPIGAHDLEKAFLCIKQFEGGWRTETGNGYHGAFQMDGQFESAYGPRFVQAWGHAGAWPPAAQIATAMTAYLSGRKFGPWPNSSLKCGL